MITVGIEFLENCLEELKPHFPAHYRALALFQDKIPLDPKYGTYLFREKCGEVVTCVARRIGKVVGYYIAFVSTGMHYSKTNTAIMDIMWVTPEFARRGVGIRLVDRVEEELKRRGVEAWYTGSKFSSEYHPGMDKFLQSRGFTPADLHYVKWIGD